MFQTNVFKFVYLKIIRTSVFNGPIFVFSKFHIFLFQLVQYRCIYVLNTNNNKICKLSIKSATNDCFLVLWQKWLLVFRDFIHIFCLHFFKVATRLLNKSINDALQLPIITYFSLATKVESFFKLLQNISIAKTKQLFVGEIELKR